MRDFRREAAAEGISQRTISLALDGMTPDQGVISRDRKQGFFAQSFLDFSAKLATPNRVTNGRAQIQRNQAYISQQVNVKLQPLLKPAMQRRGANILLDAGATLDQDASVDITNDVLAALNAALPSVATTAPAAPAQQQPQGR